MYNVVGQTSNIDEILSHFSRFVEQAKKIATLHHLGLHAELFFSRNFTMKKAISRHHCTTAME